MACSSGCVNKNPQLPATAVLEKENSQLDLKRAEAESSASDTKSMLQFAEAKIGFLNTEKEDLQKKVRCCLSAP